MGQVTLSGTLQGLASSSSDAFLGSQFSTTIKLRTGSKGFVSASGILSRTLSNASAFVEMSAVGDGRDVPRANLLFMKGDSRFQVRITQDDGASGVTVSTIQCEGLLILEVPDNYAITLLEIAASTKIEYFASGAV